MQLHVFFGLVLPGYAAFKVVPDLDVLYLLKEVMSGSQWEVLGIRMPR